MDAEKQKQLIEAGKFRENNGSVMRVLNILDHTFHELKDIEYALPNLSRGEIVESINYLNEEGYIHLRSIADKANQVFPANTSTAKCQQPGPHQSDPASRSSPFQQVLNVFKCYFLIPISA